MCSLSNTLAEMKVKVQAILNQGVKGKKVTILDQKKEITQDQTYRFIRSGDDFAEVMNAERSEEFAQGAGYGSAMELCLLAADLGLVHPPLSPLSVSHIA